MKPCCFDATMNACGITSSFTQNKCVTMNEPDPQCPSVMVVGVDVPGCCRPNGFCGLDGSPIGMGCVDLGMASAMGGSMVEAPPPTMCNPDGGAPAELDGGVGGDPDGAVQGDLDGGADGGTDAGL